MLGRAGEEGQRRRLEQAKRGVRTWTPPYGLGKPMVMGEDQVVEPKTIDKPVHDFRSDDDFLDAL